MVKMVGKTLVGSLRVLTSCAGGVERNSFPWPFRLQGPWIIPILRRVEEREENGMKRGPKQSTI